MANSGERGEHVAVLRRRPRRRLRCRRRLSRAQRRPRPRSAPSVPTPPRRWRARSAARPWATSSTARPGRSAAAFPLTPSRQSSRRGATARCGWVLLLVLNKLCQVMLKACKKLAPAPSPSMGSCASLCCKRFASVKSVCDVMHLPPISHDALLCPCFC